MNNQARDTLCELVARYGSGLGDDPRRCEALLRDVCGQCKPEISVLVSAARERVPSALMAASGGAPLEATLSKLAKRLHEQLGLRSQWARWGVESWALALNVVQASDFRIPFQCPACNATGLVTRDCFGRVSQCLNCQAPLRISNDGVPQLQTASRPVTDPLPHAHLSQEIVPVTGSTIIVSSDRTVPTPPPPPRIPPKMLPAATRRGSYAENRHARTKVSRPAIVLVAMGILTVSTHVAIILGSFSDSPTMLAMIEFNDAVWRTFVLPEASDHHLLLLRVVVSIVAVQAGLIEIIAGIRMRTMQGFYLAHASALLIMLPYVSPLCFVGLPLGVWIIMILWDARVRAAFNR